MTRRERPEALRDMQPFVLRVLRSMTRRASEGESDALLALLEIRAETDRQILEAARNLHAWGYSWAWLAREMGVTRQAATQRFGGET